MVNSPLVNSLVKSRSITPRPTLRHAARIALFLLGSTTMLAHAAELVRIPNVTLVESDLNDGDSFQVNAAGNKLHLRLYYVDCPETKYGRESDLKRIRQQQRHFGLEDISAVVTFGEQATAYTQQALSRPFTIHTSYARAFGGSRYYAFIQTHDGEDLAHLLVKQGLARVHGKTRPSPDNTPSEIVLADLQTLRDTAQLKRTGIWQATNPDLLIELRQQQRAADEEIATLRKSISKTRTLDDEPLNLNSASSKQLQQIPKIGPVTAAKIIAGRPYRSVKDLLNISGIGEKTLAVIAEYVTVK